MDITVETPDPHPVAVGLDEWLAWPVDTRGPRPSAVAVPNDRDVDELAVWLRQLECIELQFPKWTDGRAYSQARLLRGRLRYAGGLRAQGAVLVDMLPLLQRCGFDAATLRADQDPGHARLALDAIPAHYQGDWTDPRPAHRRAAAFTSS